MFDYLMMVMDAAYAEQGICKTFRLSSAGASLFGCLIRTVAVLPGFVLADTPPLTVGIPRKEVDRLAVSHKDGSLVTRDAHSRGHWHREVELGDRGKPSCAVESHLSFSAGDPSVQGGKAALLTG
jgi:hypothetical protein